MEFVGIGDLHFGKLDNLVPDVDAKIAASLRRVFGYCLNHGVRHVLLYGDVCEVPRLKYSAQTALYTTLLHPKYRDLNFHVILGNHDFAEDGTHSLEVMAAIAKAVNVNFEVYTKATRVVLDEERFNFMPYPFSDMLGGCVNVGHFEVAGSLRDNGRQIDDGVDPKKFQAVMGHLHTMHKVRNVHYSGTLYQTNFGETEDKFFHHCKVKDGVLRVNNVAFKSPWVLRNLQVKTRKDLAALEEAHDDDRLMFKLFVKDGADIDVEQVLRDNPSVVKHNVFKTKQELKLMLSEGWKLDQDLIEQSVSQVDETEVVTRYLSQHLTSSQVKRGLSIIRDLRG